METEPSGRSYIHDLQLVELFDIEYYRDLEMWVKSHSRSLKMVPFESFGVIFESYIPHLYLAPPQRTTASEFREDV